MDPLTGATTNQTTTTANPQSAPVGGLSTADLAFLASAGVTSQQQTQYTAQAQAMVKQSQQPGQTAISLSDALRDVTATNQAADAAASSQSVAGGVADQALGKNSPASVPVNAS